MQQAMTKYEQKILNDIKGLTEREQEKLARIFHLIKYEIINSELNEKQITDEFLSVCGTWDDDRTVNEQLDDIYSNRKSTDRTEKIF